MQLKNVAVALATVGVWAMPSVSLAASATAEISAVHIQLIDLDPSDGVAPSIAFDAASPGYTWAFTNPGGSFDGHGGALGLALSSAASGAGSSASAAISAGDIFLPGGGPSASASASALGAGSAAYSYAQVLNSGFTLSANTQLVMTAVPGSVTVVTMGARSVTAQASIDVRSDDPNGPGSFATAFEYYDLSGGTLQTGSSHPALLTVTWTNASAAPTHGWIDAQVTADVSGAAPVPEPASALLMLAGLLPLGGLVSRRARR